MAPVELEIVDQVVAVPISHIEVGERLRPIDPVWAQALGGIMAADGQKTPIEVCRLPGHQDFLLVTGGHRLEGARSQNWRTIKALIVDSNAIDRRLSEVSENLWRKGLAPIDRAAFIAELHNLLRARAGIGQDAKPQSIAAKARWSEQVKAEAQDASDTMSRAYGFTTEVAESLDMNRRSVERDLELHRGLSPAVAEQIRALPVAKNATQLRTLAKLPEAEQRNVVGLIVEGSAKDVTAAQAMLDQKPKPDGQKKALSAFLGSFSRMGARERRLALQELAKLGLPTGVSLTFGKGEGDA